MYVCVCLCKTVGNIYSVYSEFTHLHPAAADSLKGYTISVQSLSGIENLIHIHASTVHNMNMDILYAQLFVCVCVCEVLKGVRERLKK